MARITLGNGKFFDADTSTSILEAARASGIALEHSCRSGRCGVCKAPVLEGQTRVLRPEESLSDAEKTAGLVLTCCRAAESDVALDVEDLGRLADVPAKILPSRISAMERLAADVIGVTLRLPPNASLAFLPGQYVDVMSGDIRRSYSLANAPRADGLLELHIRAVEGGLMSDYWFNRARVNDLLRLEAPLGSFFLRDTAPRNLVFLATGTGIAPVKAMLEEIAADPAIAAGKAISVYWGNRTPADFYWQPGASIPGITFHRVLSRPHDGWDGRRGHVQQALLADGVDLADSMVYACGSEVMIHSARETLTEGGLAPRHFLFDAFVSSN